MENITPQNTDILNVLWQKHEHESFLYFHTLYFYTIKFLVYDKEYIQILTRS